MLNKIWEKRDLQNIKIRNMTVDDLPAVYRLGVEEFDMSKIYHQYWSLTEVSFHLERDAELCVVAEKDGEIVGFALGHRKFSAWEKDLGHLEWIAVSRRYQQMGIASRLCEEMLKRFESLGVRKVLADVVADENDASRRLLEKFSFKEAFSVRWYLKEI